MSVRLLTGHVLDRLAELSDESVHCVVTSPPYFGLRSYQTEPQIWGGCPACGHEWGALERGKRKDMLPADETTSISRSGSTDRQDGAAHDGGRFCLRCKAWRGELGLEPTPALYIEHLVAVFAQVRRVMRKDATLWVVIGDSYASTAPGTRNAPQPKGSKANSEQWANMRPDLRQHGIKPKDLLGIPWRLAFALQDGGWWLRQDNVWHKPNPMPESTEDRTTRSHEFVFHLSKAERYFYDGDAIKEPFETDPKENYPARASIVGRGGQLFAEARGNDRDKSGGFPASGGRNKRSVWTVATAPSSVPHFATYPPALIEPCILAGCPPGGTVLDPFIGAGTTAIIAERLARNCIGIELSPKYAAIAERRARSPGFPLEISTGRPAQIPAPVQRFSLRPNPLSD